MHSSVVTEHDDKLFWEGDFSESQRGQLLKFLMIFLDLFYL
jgi:hypothetical protein